jgi:hypothetical protein
MLVLFYSLAVHMYRSLGAWPSIGEEGFPRLLVVHADIAVNFFIILLLFTLFAVPVAIFVCAFVRRWRHLILYLGLYAALFFLGWGLMQLAPKPFLNWWWD